jgi:hypothetical protein
MRLLEESLYPLFCSTAGWEPFAWRTVAGVFTKLPGVKRRQVDGRTGGDRTGRMPVVYNLATGYADLPNNEKTDLPRLSKPYHQAQLQAEISKLLIGPQ